MKKISILLIIFAFSTLPIFSQKDFNQEQLFAELKAQDSLLFGLGYNQCDTSLLRKLVSDDFEFYHDQGGLMESKEMFLNGIPNLCNMNYKPTRVLREGSMEVFPLFNNGKLYGAIQRGVHEFYGEEEGKEKYLTSTAIFTHVWMLEDGNWRVRRILSYNHVVPDRD